VRTATTTKTVNAAGKGSLHSLEINPMAKSGVKTKTTKPKMGGGEKTSREDAREEANKEVSVKRSWDTNCARRGLRS